MANYEKQLLNLCFCFGMTLLHAPAQYIYQYQKASVKALVQVELYMHKQNPYFKAIWKKNVNSKSCYFAKKQFWHQTSSYKCSGSLYCVGKVLNCFAQSVMQVEFPAYALSVIIF